MVNVGYAHAVVGNRDAGGYDAADTVNELTAGDHTASALEGEGIGGKFFSRRELIKAAHKSEREFGTTLFLEHSRNLHPPNILA